VPLAIGAAAAPLAGLAAARNSRTTRGNGRLPRFDLAPHELHFGLFRADGSAKPVTDVWRRFGRRAALDLSQFDGPDERTWYEGLPRTLEQAYRQWRKKRSEVTEEI
jgi:hypothetical protein